MAGTNKSGDLADASKSIPRGTLAASGTTTVMYYVFAFLFAAVADRVHLTNLDEIFCAEVSWPFKWVVVVGIFLSCIGAALQSIAGAPKIFAAMTEDDLIPYVKKLARNKIFIYSFNGGICAITIMIGSLDQVAPLVSIFFLGCYGFVNIACFLLDWLGSPNWRPQWKYYNKITSLCGVIFCFAIMIMISWFWAIVATLIALALYAYIEKRTKERDWGDGLVGMRAERARDALLKLDKYKTHVKNWRPKYLVLGYVDERGEVSSKGILKLLKQLRKGTGLAIYGTVVQGEPSEEEFRQAREKEKTLDGFLKKNKLQVFSKVLLSSDVENGLTYLIQGSGLGGLNPNTVLLSWPTEWQHDENKINRFVHVVNNATTYGHVITVLKPEEAFNDD